MSDTAEIEEAGTAFAIRYDGEILRNGTMSVRDLTPALIGIMDAIDEVSDFLYEGQPHPILKIKATEEGSFLTQLVLFGHDSLRDVRNLLLSNNVDAVLRVSAILTIFTGAYSYIQRINDPNKKIKKIIDAGGDVSLIEFTDGSTYEVPNKVREISNRPAFRIAIEKSLAPLEQEGISTFEIDNFRDDIIVINDTELPRFEYDAPEEILETIEIEETLRAETIALVRENKWRFDNFELKFNANILDEEFLDRVFDDGESFTVNDSYRCLVRVVTYKNKNGEVKKTRSILKVLMHSTGMYQPSLTDSDD